MKKLILAIVAAGVAVLPLVAQQHHDDPDKKMAGPGSIPSGWKGRLDSGDKTLAGVKAMTMDGGIHFMTGPAGIYYRPNDKATGAYMVQATFTQLAPAAHPEAYGIIVGGADLEGAGQKYTYFLVRQDGKFMIKRRNGEATPTVADWTDNAAVKKPDAGGKSVNALAIDVTKDKVRFLVNGTEVSTADAAQVDTAGIAGLRINHNLNVHVEGFAVKSH
jgi:hypothetical protein